MKKPCNIFICIIINFGCSKEITVEYNETIRAQMKKTFYDDSIETSENLTTFENEIKHFKDKHAEVRNIFDR